jgi:peptide/nickel transport system substrate-binding protein
LIARLELAVKHNFAVYMFLACNAAFNYGHYCSPEVDRELGAAREIEAPAERLAHYHIAAEHILQDLPIIYLYHYKWLYASAARLSGFTPYPDGVIRPQGLRLE